MKTKYHYFSFFLFMQLFLINYSFGDFEAARQLYDQAKYQDALNEALKSECISAQDFYNLGNIYFKLQKYGAATSYFEKAKSIILNSSTLSYSYKSHLLSDIEHNTKLSITLLDKSGLSYRDPSLFAGKIIPLSRSLSKDFMLITVAIATILLCSYLLRFKKKFDINSSSLSSAFQALLQAPLFYLFSFAWFICIFVIAVLVYAQSQPLVAVIADHCSARSGPSDTFTELKTFPAGALLQLRSDQREGWQQVQFGGNNVAWIKEKDLLKL